MAQSNRDKKRAETVQRYKKVFGSPDGEEIIKDLIKSCGILNPMFSNDPIVMSYNEGRRSVVLDMINLLDFDEKRIYDLTRQVQKERNNDNG